MSTKITERAPALPPKTYLKNLREEEPASQEEIYDYNAVENPPPPLPPRDYLPPPRPPKRSSPPAPPKEQGEEIYESARDDFSHPVNVLINAPAQNYVPLKKTHKRDDRS